MLLSPWLHSLKLRSLQRGPFRRRRARRHYTSRRRDLVTHSAAIAGAENLEDRCLLSITVGDATVVEGNTGTTNANFTVTVSPPSGQTVIVQYATLDGTAIAGSDYQPVSNGVLVFNPGQTQQTIPIPVIGDTLDENNETFFVTLFNATGDTISDGLGIGTILDDDPSPTINISDATVVEGDTPTTIDAFFEVTLTEPSLSTVTVDFTATGISATQGDDFFVAFPPVVPGQMNPLIFDPGEVSKVIVVTVRGDNLDEDNETFRVNLANPTNASIGDGEGIGTIIDDDPLPSLAISNVTVTEGNTGVVDATFDVTLSPRSGRNVTVDFATADNTATAGDDYVSTSGTLTFTPNGPLTQRITVPVLGDELDEPDMETFFVNLTNAMNAVIADNQGVGTIVDDDPVPVLRINDVTVTEGNSGTVNALFIVTLAPQSGRTVTVNFATANGTATAGSDFVTTNGVLTFDPGETTKVISVPVIGDTIDEFDETFFVNLSGAVNATIAANQGGDSQGMGTIIDDDNQPALNINDVTVIEGDTGVINAMFNVSLTSPSGKEIRVNFATRAGSATAGDDFASTSDTLVFAPGVTSQTIIVPVLADLLAEGPEDFFVDLSMPTFATIADGTGRGLIVDNDAGPAVIINDVTVVEGFTTAVFTVTLVAPSTQTVLVDFATANGSATAGLDYAITNGTLTFAPGQTIQTISVPVLDDIIDEPDETFLVNLSNPRNASISDGQGVGTIVDNDAGPVINVINDPSVIEGDSGTVDAFFEVTLTSPSTMPITVNFATTGQTATAGADFVPQNGVLVFAPGETTKVITVPVIGDLLDEMINETFRVDLSGPTNASIGDGRGIGTIIDDDDPPMINISDATVTEGNTGITNALFTVSLTAPSGQTVSVNFATANGSATAGNDYTAVTGTLVFAPGVTTQTIVVPVLSDVIDEGMQETFVVNLSNPVNAGFGDSQGTGTILDDDDPPTIIIGDTQVVEGNSGQSIALFTVTLSTFSALPVSVNFETVGQTATEGVDFGDTSGTLTFVPGQSVMQIGVPVIGDTIDENNETFEVRLSNPINVIIGDDTGVGTIIDDDPLAALSISNAMVIEGDTGVINAVFTVSLSAASAKPITVNFATADGTATAGMDYAATNGTLNFAPGGPTSQMITVPVLGDTIIEPNETFNVNLSGATNATIADGLGVGTIIDDDGPEIRINDVALAEGNLGNTPFTFTVTLSAVSPLPVTVNFATANGSAIAGSDYFAANGTVTFAPGELSRPVTVSVIGDNIVEPNETFTVNLSNASGASIADNQGVGTIVNDDPGPPQPQPPFVTINDVTVSEGASAAVFTVSLSSPIASNVTVAFNTMDGSAIAQSDYTPSGGTVTIPAGQTTATISVPIIDDKIEEPTEQFFVNLTGVTSSNASIADSQGVGTILDNDKDDNGDNGDNGDNDLHTIERRVNRDSDDAEEQRDGDVDHGSSDLELVREDSNQTVGIRFTDLKIPAGSTIHRAWIQFTADETDSRTTELTIEGELTADARTFREDDHNISSRARTSSDVDWNPAPWDKDGEKGPDQRTSDISSIIQEIVSQNGWQSGNAIVIIITGEGKRVAVSHDGDRDDAPKLVVEFTPPGTTAVTQAVGTQDSSASEEPAADDLSVFVPVQVQSTGTGQADNQEAAAGGHADSASVDSAAQSDSDAFSSAFDSVLDGGL